MLLFLFNYTPCFRGEGSFSGIRCLLAPPEISTLAAPLNFIVKFYVPSADSSRGNPNTFDLLT